MCSAVNPLIFVLFCVSRVMNQRISKTSLYLQLFEESINRKSKYSIQGVEEFCMRPDTLLDRCALAVLLSPRTI